MLQTDLLNSPLFKGLKKEIHLRIEDYFNTIICPADPIKPYITESWYNITKPGEKHHKHKHPNSIVSGVYYITPGTICFYKEYNSTINVDRKSFNEFNGYSYNEQLKKGEVILFPSQLEHGVQQYEGNIPRQSIAFNIFIKGKLGTLSRLTGLQI